MNPSEPSRKRNFAPKVEKQILSEENRPAARRNFSEQKIKTFHYHHHLPHVKEVYKALKFIFQEKNYADRAIEKVMRANKKWGVKDRSFVSETVYDMVRNWRLLLVATDVDLVLTDQNFWTIFGAWLVYRGYELPELGKFKHINDKKLAEKFGKYSRIRKLRESVPDWLDKLGEKELGKKWDDVLTALNQKPNMILRVNTLKTTPKELQDILEVERVETQPVKWSPVAIELPFSRNVFRTEAFRNGLFEVQDSASQMVSDFLAPQPGMRVIDACAGTGGKTLHLASIMRNKGRIIALEQKEHKLQELKKRAMRAGANNIEPRVIESSKTIKRLHNTADRLLLDVPCSGLGVLRRNPDAKWKLTPEDVEQLHLQQAELLEKYSPLTKVGGRMVYSVCSILPSEGEEQVKKFLSKHSNEWNFVGEKRYSPDEFECDGFYMALLERTK